jgi:hypothetical protein
MDMKHREGYGYEWDAVLHGGPADGCVDRVIEMEGETPPEILKKIVDGEEMRRESLSEKIIEYLTESELDGDQRVAVYLLRGDCEDKCMYDYLETVTMDQFRERY